jgi:WD40 repeat protein
MIWETQTGKELLTLNGHRLGVYSVDISADGKRIASASNDQVVQVWDVQTGLLLFSGSGTSVAFSPDGKSLATVSGKGLKVLDAQTGKEILSMNAVAGGPFHSLKFSPDGKRLACANSKAITVWDVQTAQLLLTLETASSYVAFSPDGKRLAGEAEGNTLRIWNSHTGLVLLTLKGHTQEVTGLAFSPDGKRLASCSWDKTVRVWDTLSGHELLALQGRGGNRNAVAFSPDGHRLAAGSNENGIVVWDATPLGIKN